MPLPVPAKGESRDNFIARFMGNDVAKKEFPDQKQRLAVAFSTWRKAKGIKRANMTEERTHFSIEFLDRDRCHELMIHPLKHFEGVDVVCCKDENRKFVHSLHFSKSNWNRDSIKMFLRRYGKQVLSYEKTIPNDIYGNKYMQKALDMLLEKETRKLCYADIDTTKELICLSKSFKMPYEFEFTALCEGTFNGLYYPFNEIAKSYLSLEGKPITIDHSKSVADVVGKVTKVELDTEKKSIKAKGFITDEKIAKKIHDGLVTGMSSEIMVDKKKTPEHGLTAFNAEFEVISIVQHPACPECMITQNSS